MGVLCVRKSEAAPDWVSTVTNLTARSIVPERYEGMLDRAKKNTMAKTMTVPNTRITTFVTLAEASGFGAPGATSVFEMAPLFIRRATPMKTI